MKSINFRLWFSIAFLMLLPAVYSTVRVYYLHSLPDNWSFSIAAQSAWLHLAYEVLQEAVILPLYFVFGQVVADKVELRSRVSSSIFYALIAFATLTVLTWVMSAVIVDGMSVAPEARDMTVSFIRLESLAILVNTINDLSVVVLVVLGRYRLLMALAALRAVLVIVFDTVFLGQTAISLDWGVLGVAATNISVGLVFAVASVWLLFRLKLVGSARVVLKKGTIRKWRNLAVLSAVESAVRNLAFSLMILKLVNEVNEAGTFWVANGFIWGWLLLPILSLGMLIKQDAAVHEGRLGPRLRAYFLITGLIAVLWLVSIPVWNWFIGSAMGAPEPEKITELATLMLAFFIVFSFNNILDSYLYGMGRIDLIVAQALLVNVLYYGGAFVLYQSDIFQPTLTKIALLFGFGIVADSLVTVVQFWRFGYFKIASSASFQSSFNQQRRHS
jgi:hypothetical protein